MAPPTFPTQRGNVQNKDFFLQVTERHSGDVVNSVMQQLNRDLSNSALRRFSQTEMDRLQQTCVKCEGLGHPAHYILIL